MKCIINDQITLLRPPEGPLSAYMEPFANYLSNRGYAVSSSHRQVYLAADFSKWLGQEGRDLESINSSRCRQYLSHRAQKFKPRAGDEAALGYLIDYLCDEDLIPAEKTSVIQLTPAERCVKEYEKYLREVRALAESTIINYVPFVLHFLINCFGDEPIQLSKLLAHDVTRFVQKKVPFLHIKRAKLMTTAIRSFLRYARFCGEMTCDLTAAVPVVANWSMSEIPRGIAADQVRQLLNSIDQSTVVGRRDYAILLLLARLGLRSGEVVFLELDDIDWKAGQLSVRGKSGRRCELPLPVEVGEAIVSYLRNGRPDSLSRRVFLRSKAPNNGFKGASSIGSIVRHSIQRAGVNAPTYGAHQFRHGLATEMLRKGASLEEIGELLGHRNPQTTKIYTKVDIEALRTLALPWPGGTK